jgi:4-hydroxyproline epimerase
MGEHPTMPIPAFPPAPREPAALVPTPETIALDVVDSHTGNEPTRIIIAGFPELRGETVADRRADLVARHADVMGEVLADPHGHEAMVAGLLTEPNDPSYTAAVIYFDRAGAIGMCGHGTIGLVESLRVLGRVEAGEHLIETPVGVVVAQLNADGSVSVTNVESRRLAAGVEVHTPSLGAVSGDIAYGGNTFFLVHQPEVDLDRPVGQLLGLARELRDAAHRAGYTAVDHVELCGPATGGGADSRNFVLCPSDTYDRSPCGTGTSAIVACRAAEGALPEGAIWTQESITGSVFTARYRWADRAAGTVVPTITGTADVVAIGTVFPRAPEWTVPANPLTR